MHKTYYTPHAKKIHKTYKTHSPTNTNKLKAYIKHVNKYAHNILTHTYTYNKVNTTY